MLATLKADGTLLLHHNGSAEPLIPATQPSRYVGRHRSLNELSDREHQLLADWQWTRRAFTA